MKHYYYSMIVILVMSGISSVVQAENQSTTKTYINSIGMEFVLIPAGKFMMGTDCMPNISPNCDESEIPIHKVQIERPFYIGKYEVTQELWYKVMKTAPAWFNASQVGDSRRYPVETVSWFDVQEFIKRLNKLERTNKYRLPTEAEFEYVLRAGTTTECFFGDDVDQVGEYGWYFGNTIDRTHPVGQKKPNPFGLYDIVGNVWEWTCSDYEAYGNGKELVCSENSHNNKSWRGGSWYGGASGIRSASRSYGEPARKNYVIGFRLVFLSP